MSSNQKSLRERLVTGAVCKVRSYTDLQTSQAPKGIGLQRRAGTYSALMMIAELANASGAETRAAVGADSATGALWAMLSGKGASGPAPSAWQAAHATSSRHMPVLPAAGSHLGPDQHGRGRHLSSRSNWYASRHAVRLHLGHLRLQP